jgi:hypothetical protein
MLYANVPGCGLAIAPAVAVAKMDRISPERPMITPTISSAIAIFGTSKSADPNVTLTIDPAIFAFLPLKPGRTTETTIFLHLKHLFDELISFSFRFFYSGDVEY